jgi:transposase
MRRCWAPRGVGVAVEQTTGREHLNIHGAIDLETGTTQMLLVDRVDTQSTLALLAAIERSFPRQRRIHMIADRARCHRSAPIWEWLRRPGCRIRLHLLPPYCPHLNPIERLWGAMHKAITHNRCSKSFRAFQVEILTFLRRTFPQNWPTFCDTITGYWFFLSRKNTSHFQLCHAAAIAACSALFTGIAVAVAGLNPGLAA